MYYTVQLPTYSEHNGSKADSGTPYNSLYGEELPKGGGVPLSGFRYTKG